MSHNSFVHLCRVTTWGESHGPALGCVVDGCPPGIALTAAEIQVWLDRRKPGQSRFVTQRREPDERLSEKGVNGQRGVQDQQGLVRRSLVPTGPDAHLGEPFEEFVPWHAPSLHRTSGDGHLAAAPAER